jgi:hypothetical protein
MQRGADRKELKLVHPLKDDHGTVEYLTKLLQNVRASSSHEFAMHISGFATSAVLALCSMPNLPSDLG